MCVRERRVTGYARMCVRGGVEVCVCICEEGGAFRLSSVKIICVCARVVMCVSWCVCACMYY